MNVVAFDTETKGLDWWEPDQQAFLASWDAGKGPKVAVLSDPAQRSEFLSALAKADVIVCHNASFDIHQVRETTGFDVLNLDAEIHDTDLMSRVIYPEGQRKDRGGHGLKNLAKTLLREDADATEEAIKELGKSIGLKTLKRKGAYYEVWRAYPAQMEEYAANDAAITRQLYLLFDEKLKQNPDAQRCYDLERKVLPILIRAEQRGIGVDKEVAERLYAKFTEEEKQLREELDRELGENTYSGEGSDDALIEALQKVGVPLYRKTKTGKLSTDKFALQEFEDEYPIIETLMEWRRVTRFLSTYLAPMRQRDVVHTSFKQAEAWTGRMSSVRPNMQNMPKRAGAEVREIIKARPGYKLVVCDYDSIEVRLLAWYLGDAGFRELIANGLDPHAWMASQLWGGSPVDYRKDGPRAKERAVAKNSLFAITYGAGAPRIADMNKIPRDQAKSLISKIKGSLPGYYRLQNRIKNKIEREGYVTTLFGRRQLVNKDKSYVGLNALIQGSAADIMKQGLVNVASVHDGLNIYILHVVHDEIVLEVPEDLAEPALEYTMEAMRSAYPLDPPLEVSGTIVDNYAQAAD